MTLILKNILSKIIHYARVNTTNYHILLNKLIIYLNCQKCLLILLLININNLNKFTIKKLKENINNLN